MLKDLKKLKKDDSKDVPIGSKQKSVNLPATTTQTKIPFKRPIPTISTFSNLKKLPKSQGLAKCGNCIYYNEEYGRSCVKLQMYTSAYSKTCIEFLAFRKNFN